MLSEPKYPALHRHAAAEVLPAGEVLFSGQAVHSPAPTVALYVFVAHAVHVAAEAPV
jgi:hypothetical protein